MAVVKSPKECLVCLNSCETIFVPTEESQKIFNICCSYVKDAINIKFLINNFIENDKSLSFCKNCFDVSNNLSQLVEQLSNLKKQINDLGSSFSETIAKQRVEATTNSGKKQFSNVNTKLQATNNQNANLDASDRPSPISNELQRGNAHDSVTHLEASKTLTIEQNAVVKTENDDLFLDFKYESCTNNMSGYDEEECEANCPVTEHGNEVDPFEEIESEPTHGIVESQSIIESTQSTSELASFDTMPNNPHSQIGDVPSSSSDTIKSTETFPQNKSTVNFNINLPDGSGSRSNCNYTPETTIVNFNASKMRERAYKCNFSMCQKSYFTRAELKRHTMTHESEKPYKCILCGKVYAHAKDLKIHEGIHTGEKPYNCSSCAGTFVELKYLKRHERFHNKDKIYKCSYCDLQFKHENSWKMHEGVHLQGVFPSFKCANCEVIFTTRSSLKWHQSNAHPDAPKN